MAKRGRKKTITYDSNETRAVFGLLALFVGVIALLSYFIEGPIFVFAASLFRDATIFFTVFCFNLALHFFNSSFSLAKTRSLIGQLLFVLFYSAFLSSIFGGGEILKGDDKYKYGGIIGTEIYRFLSENIFLNFTPVVIIIMVVISVPLSLSMTIYEFLDRLGKGLQWLGKKFFPGKDSNVEMKKEIGEKPSTFGDFRKAHPDSQREAGKTKEEQASVDRKKEDQNTPHVEIKQTSVEGAYVNQELQYPDWKLPPITLLNPYKKNKPSEENIKKNADIIEQTLQSFGVRAKVVDVLIGPSVTQYALDIALGTKVSKIANLSNDLALALAADSNSVRIEAPIPGTSYVGIEVPNHERETVYSKEVLGDSKMQDKKLNLPLALGKDITGDYVVLDLQKMPHILIAGATGSGKSILTNGFILSLLMNKSPDEVKFIMVDPKQVELSDYNGIPHLLTPVITEMDKVLNALKWLIAEMERRYTIFRESQVRNIEGYNELMGFSAIPYIIVVIDEMADMMMSTNKVDTESGIVRLAQKARATGIHLVLATQRPSVDVITGLIKANIPGRIGMSVTTQIDSRVILDHIGAESLLGRGDLLYKDPAKGKTMRVQGMWVAPDEIQRIVNYIKGQVPEVHYTTEVVAKKAEPEAEGGEFGGSDDNLFADAVHVIVNAQKGSASLIQRKLSVGYNRAARLLDELEEYGVVGAANGSKPRDVLITDADEFLASLSQTNKEESN